MRSPIIDEASSFAVFERLFRCVGEAETSNVEKTHQDYRDWCVEVFIEDRVDIVCGKLAISETEMRWLVLEILHGEIQELLDSDAELPTDVDDDRLVSTLSTHGFCPAFQDDVRDVCRAVLRNWKLGKPAVADTAR